MYCPSCSMALPEGLSYCNRCGASLSFGKGSDIIKSEEGMVLGIVWGIVVVTIVLAGIMLGSMPVMKEIGLPQGSILTFVGLLFLAMMAVDSILCWQLFRLSSRAREPRGLPLLPKLDTNALSAGREQPLLEPRPSVTENTTRNFEPVFEERINTARE